MTSTIDRDQELAESVVADEFVHLCASVAGLDGRRLADRLVEIEAARRRLEAATLAILDEAERRGAFQDDGHVTVGSWARATVNWSHRETTDRVHALHLIRLCPSVATELGAGRLGVAQTFELARVRANPRVGDQIAGRVGDLLESAQTLDFDGFRKVVRRWEQLSDVDGAHHGHEAAHQGRRAAMSRFDDTFHLTAQFGVAQGTAMAEILDAFAEAEFQADWERVKNEHGADAAPSMITRTAAQRRADALHAIFLAAVGDHDGMAPGPVVNLVCDLQTFEEHVARLVNGRVPPAREPDAAGAASGRPASPVTPAGDDAQPGCNVSMGSGFGLRRCETIDGVGVDPGDVIAAAVIGHVRRVVINQAGVVVDCGRKTRLFRGVAREMAWLLGTTCCWPGCGHRLGVQVDHLDEFARAGPTDQANADPLDGRHNRFKTNHDYRIRRDEHGFLHVCRPDGSEIKPH